MATTLSREISVSVLEAVALGSVLSSRMISFTICLVPPIEMPPALFTSSTARL